MLVDGKSPLLDHFVIYQAVETVVTAVFHFSTSGDVLDPILASFAFPDAEDLGEGGAGTTGATTTTDASGGSRSNGFGCRYSLVLTDKRGRKQFGLCHRYRCLRYDGTAVAECAVLLSHYPWSLMFSHVVEATLARRAYGSDRCRSLLQALVLQPFPTPGSALF